MIRRILGAFIKLQLANKSQVLWYGALFIILMALVSTQWLLYCGISNHINTKKSELLTADLEIKSNFLPSEQQIEKIESLLLTMDVTERLVFPARAKFYGNKSNHVEIVGIQKNYPLRGDCLAKLADGSVQPVNQILSMHDHAVVISMELFQKTDLDFGSAIQIGNFVGVVAAVVIKEPDIISHSLLQMPRVYVPLKEAKRLVPKINVASWSRLYRFQDPLMAIPITKKIQIALESVAKNNLMVRNFQDMPVGFYKKLQKIRRYSNILLILTMMLSVIGIGILVKNMMIQKKDGIHQLRLLGVSLNDICMVHILWVSMVGVLCGGVSLLLGGWVAKALGQYLHISLIITIWKMIFNWNVLIIASLIIVFMSIVIILSIKNNMKKLIFDIRKYSKNNVIFWSFFIGFSLLIIFSYGMIQYASPYANQKKRPSLLYFNLKDHQLSRFKSIVPNSDTKFQYLHNQFFKLYKPLLKSDSKTSNFVQILNIDYLVSQNKLDEDDKILAGNWFTKNDNIFEASILESVANQLKLGIGDDIEIDSLMPNRRLKVTSIRQTKIEKINQAMIIVEPSVLDQFKWMNWAGQITTQSLEDAHRITIKLMKEFFNLTVINITASNEKINKLLRLMFLLGQINVVICTIILGILYIIIRKTNKTIDH